MLETKNERLTKLRKYLGMNQSEFSKKLLISQATLSLIESGQRELTERSIKLVCVTFNVNYDWIVYGQGEMFTEDEDAIAIVDSLMTSDEEFWKKAFVMVARMSKEERDVIEKLIKEMAK